MDRERVVMQTGLEQESDPTFNPRPSSGFEDNEESEEIDKFVDFEFEEEDDDDNEDEDEDEDDFTFACAVDDDSSSTANDIFDNGKIRSVFPLFDQSLIDLPHLPPVKNIFVETGAPPPSIETTTTNGSGEAAGSHCAWSGKAVEATDSAASPEECKKSNSTGFSKIWRFKEMTNRSHSDGKDAFVFLNKLAPKKKTKDSTAAAAGKAATAVAAKKDGRKGKKAATSISAHEVYVKSRAAATKEEDRRRTYLPYKPVGFFTNVHGGMSKNVHPF